MKSLPNHLSRSAKLSFFLAGCQAAVPIAVGYIPIGITFGLLAKAAGVENQIALMMSLVIFAGASQFVAVNLLSLGTGMYEIVLTTLVLNLRHLLMSASLSQRVEHTASKPYRALLAFGITDETFTVASFRAESELPREFVLGLNLLAFTAWNAGTWMGVFLAGGLPPAVKNSMGIALYVMFIGLLVPACVKSRPALYIALLAMLINAGLYYVPLLAGVSMGLKIILTTVVTALVGTVLWGRGEQI